MRGRGDRLLLALVVALAAVGVLLLVSQSRPARLAADFTLDYSAGVLLREGHLSAPYQQNALSATIHRVAPQSAIDPRLPYNKPLAAALPAAVLSLLPIEAAFRVWQAISLLLMLGSIILLQRNVPLGRNVVALGSVALLAAAPTWATLTEGQVTPLVLIGASLLIVAAVGQRGIGPQLRPALTAAVGGALIAAKPQYVPAYLLILLAFRRWHALVAAGTGSAIVLMSPLLGGTQTLLAMLNNAMLANRAVSIRVDETWSGVLGTVMPATAATIIGIVLFIVVLLALGIVAWRPRLDAPAFAALAGILTVLASPHALPHDLLLLAVPAWLTFELARRQALPNPTAAWLLIDLALIVDLRGIGLPLAAIAMTAVLAWTVWRFRQRAALQQRRPPVALAG